MREMFACVEVSMGRQGRLVIPAPLRRALEKPDRITRRLKARFVHVPVERALVDEFACRTARVGVMAVVLDASALLA